MQHSQPAGVSVPVHFTDVSDASGVGKPEAKGMGVVLADLNNDGWPDIMVANDTWPNFLFLSNSKGFPQPLPNDGGTSNHWLEVVLLAVKSNRLHARHADSDRGVGANGL